MTHSFSTEEHSEISRLKALYPDPKSAIMPVLWMAQKKWNWLSEDVLKTVADVMQLPYAHVLGVASFYTMYFKKPMGRNHVQVCTNVSCMLRGGVDIYTQVKDALGVGHNQATADGKFSLEEVECMGACGGAPMIAVNETFYENIDAAKVTSILAGCK